MTYFSMVGNTQAPKLSIFGSMNSFNTVDLYSYIGDISSSTYVEEKTGFGAGVRYRLSQKADPALYFEFNFIYENQNVEMLKHPYGLRPFKWENQQLWMTSLNLGGEKKIISREKNRLDILGSIGPSFNTYTNVNSYFYPERYDTGLTYWDYKITGVRIKAQLEYIYLIADRAGLGFVLYYAGTLGRTMTNHIGIGLALSIYNKKDCDCPTFD